MNLTKSKWEAVVNKLISAKLREAHRLLGVMREKPNPSLARLATMDLMDVHEMLLMRDVISYIDEREYAFIIDKEGEPNLIHATKAYAKKIKTSSKSWGECTCSGSHTIGEIDDDCEE